MWPQLQSAFGLGVLVLIAWGLSENRRAALSWRLIVAAVALQIGIALLLLEAPPAAASLA
jgi:concentrative nucleoside transporter, CNT family